MARAVGSEKHASVFLVGLIQRFREVQKLSIFSCIFLFKVTSLSNYASSVSHEAFKAPEPFSHSHVVLIISQQYSKKSFYFISAICEKLHLKFPKVVVETVSSETMTIPRYGVFFFWHRPCPECSQNTSMEDMLALVLWCLPFHKNLSWRQKFPFHGFGLLRALHCTNSFPNLEYHFCCLLGRRLPPFPLCC